MHVSLPLKKHNSSHGSARVFENNPNSSLTYSLRKESPNVARICLSRSKISEGKSVRSIKRQSKAQESAYILMNSMEESKMLEKLRNNAKNKTNSSFATQTAYNAVEELVKSSKEVQTADYCSPVERIVPAPAQRKSIIKEVEHRLST
jgi:hypothetical protein